MHRRRTGSSGLVGRERTRKAGMETHNSTKSTFSDSMDNVLDGMEVKWSSELKKGENWRETLEKRVKEQQNSVIVSSQKVGRLSPD